MAARDMIDRLQATREQPVSSAEAPSMVSLFSGAGGMDVALERAGWRTIVATDHDPTCMDTLAKSQAAAIEVRGKRGVTHLDGAALITADARELSAADLRPRGAGSTWVPDLVVGGPPCQPWSSAGLQKGFSDDRGQLIEHMFRLVDELKPRMVLFENVRGLLTAVGPTGRPGEVVTLIKSAYEDMGYATTFATLNAADYGAAQRRVRFYMMATRKHELPVFPPATHDRRAGNALFGELEPWRSLQDLLSEFPEPDEVDVVKPAVGKEEVLAALDPGTGVKTGGKVENNRPSGHWGYRQDSFLADLTVPSRTIRAASTPDWIRLPAGGHRRLTWRECAALQGFPAQWQFQGAPTARFRQIGNAVQADVVEVLGRALLDSLQRGPRRARPQSHPFPAEFSKRVQYTIAEHRTNSEHRVRVRATVD